MNNKVETQGKTVKDAVAEALLRLGARREEVIVKVVEEPKSGFLGLLGGRPAKVMVEKKRGGRSRGGGGRRRPQGGHSLSDNDSGRQSEGGQKARGDSRQGRRPAARSEDDRQQGRDRRPRRGGDNEGRKSDGGRGEPRQEYRGSSRGRNRRPRAAAGTEPSSGEKDMNARSGREQGPGRERRPRQMDNDRNNYADGDKPGGRNRRSSRGRNRRTREQAGAQVAPRAAAAQSPAAPEEVRSDAARRPERSRPAPARETVSRKSTSLANNQQETSGMENKPATGSTSGTVIREGIMGTAHARAVRNLPDTEIKEALEKMTFGMLVRAGFPNRCQVVDGEYLQVRVVTDDASAGMLIGRHGSAVDSVEHLVERMISTAHGDRVKMNLDINNYRRRRQDTLADRVFDAMAKVRETGQEFHMEPMNARERRLVHLQVAETEGLKTVTVIEDGAKHVVISQGEQDKAQGAAAATIESPAPETGEPVETPADEG